MKYNETEYSSLRTELIHHDRICLSILGILLTASTTIYGLVSQKQEILFLLIVLSVIWFVGFLYILEKRSTIRRISMYIEDTFEQGITFSCNKNSFDRRVINDEICFYWERYSGENRYSNQHNQEKEKNEKQKMPTVSPLFIEFSLLVITNLVNTFWLWCLFFELDREPATLLLALASTLVAIISICFSTHLVNKYYQASRHTTMDKVLCSILNIK